MLSACASRQPQQAPFSVDKKLFDFSQPQTLGLTKPEGLEQHIVFFADELGTHYNHGVVLLPFKDQLFMQWQSSAKDEDGADTQVLYTSSQDGLFWREEEVLASVRPEVTLTNGGWWTDGNRLVAYINVWPEAVEPRGGHVEYRVSEDGFRWSDSQPLRFSSGDPVNGILEQDLKALPGGRILTALHQQPGLKLTPLYTDDPTGTRDWQLGRLPNLRFDADTSRELEPSWYQKSDGTLVMVFRDQTSSYRVLASESHDQGETWTPPLLTEMPDSRAKQSAGNLPCGAAYLVNNPSGFNERSPLVVSLSKDGERFTHAFLLADRSDLPLMKYEGKYKRAGFSYPKSVVWNDYLWVGVAANKEDVMVIRVPVASLCGLFD